MAHAEMCIVIDRMSSVRGSMVLWKREEGRGAAVRGGDTYLASYTLSVMMVLTHTAFYRTQYIQRHHVVLSCCHLSMICRVDGSEDLSSRLVFKKLSSNKRMLSI